MSHIIYIKSKINDFLRWADKMKTKSQFLYMKCILSIFSAFVGAYFAWYFTGADKSPSDFLIFLVVFSFGFGIATILMEKRIKEITTDERIDKILDKSARNGFVVVWVGLVALGIFAPKPFNLVSVSVLAIGILAYLISSIVYDKIGDVKGKTGR